MMFKDIRPMPKYDVDIREGEIITVACSLGLSHTQNQLRR